MPSALKANAMAPSIDINLRRDFADFFRDHLVWLGYGMTGVVDSEQDCDDRRLKRMARIHFGVHRRLVSPNPRQILKSKDFACSPKYQGALDQIERIIQDGDDLTPYLSTKIKEVDYNDALLNDWGIHHLHLGTKVELNGFMNRTGPLLYCRFEEDNVYFIAILPHGSLTMQKLIKTVHQNWPESLSQFRAHGFKGSQLTDKEIKELRRKNANYCLEVEPDISYLFPGGGTTPVGTNATDAIRASYLLEQIRQAEQDLIDMFPGIEERAKQRGKFFPDPAVFKLGVVGDTFCAVEDTSNYVHPLNLSFKIVLPLSLVRE